MENKCLVCKNIKCPCHDSEGNYIVKTEYGCDRFRDLSTAIKYFDLCKPQVIIGIMNTVELRDLRTGEILNVYIAPEYKGE